MKFFNSLKLSVLGIAIVSSSFVASAQISAYRQTHQNLLAKQNRIQDRIKVEEAQNYARDLYGDKTTRTNSNTDLYNEDNNTANKTIDVSRYSMPIKHRVVNSHYGYRKQFGRNHRGVDLKANIGDTVYAAFTGKVRLTKFERNGYGFYIIVRHDNGLETYYAHLSKFLVKENQYVKAGTPIALSGNTGRSTGPHLHFETRYNGNDINPEKIFDFVNGRTLSSYYNYNHNDNASSTRQNSAQRGSKRRR